MVVGTVKQQYFHFDAHAMIDATVVKWKRNNVKQRLPSHIGFQETDELLCSLCRFMSQEGES